MKKDGTLTAIQGTWYVDTGYYSFTTQAQVAIGSGELMIMAQCPNWDLKNYVVVTNRNASGATRGFGGQAFLPRTASKVKALRAMLDRAGNPAPIEVDGGIDLLTVRHVVRAGAEILVAGSSIFHAPDIPAAARALRFAAEEALAPGKARPR